jgi:riboflavin transporter FmnP
MVLRKIRPRYKKALIPALIICFIIAVILLLILNKYFFKPIFEKKGSAPPVHSIGVTCLVKEEGLRIESRPHLTPSYKETVS